jgi:hypothetical protein
MFGKKCSESHLFRVVNGLTSQNIHVTQQPPSAAKSAVVYRSWRNKPRKVHAGFAKPALDNGLRGRSRGWRVVDDEQIDAARHFLSFADHTGLLQLLEDAESGVRLCNVAADPSPGGGWSPGCGGSFQPYADVQYPSLSRLAGDRFRDGDGRRWWRI